MTESNDYYDSENSPRQNTVLKVAVVYEVKIGFNVNSNRNHFDSHCLQRRSIARRFTSL